MDNPTTKTGKAKIIAGGRTDSLKAIADELGDKLDTKVTIVLGRKKGQLQINFSTVSDLKRILATLGHTPSQH